MLSNILEWDVRPHPNQHASLLCLSLISVENLKATLSSSTFPPAGLNNRQHSDTEPVLLSSQVTSLRDLCNLESSADNSNAEIPEQLSLDLRSLQQSQINDVHVKVPLSFCFHTQFQLLRLYGHPDGD